MAGPVLAAASTRWPRTSCASCCRTSCKDGRGRLDTYFIRVYNPVWTNPDGLSWMEVLTDEDKVGCFVALTPTWNESAYFADYVLPMGHGPRAARHPLL